MAGDRRKQKKKYQLYLMATNEENIDLAKAQRFNRINSRYILVYTDELLCVGQSAHYHIIDEKETAHLSDSEKVWLLEANVQIIAEETEKKQDELLKQLSKRITRLEKELEIEAEKISKRQGSLDEA